MIWRFSLYGFLKNQQYYDPFIALAFYEKLGSWFLVGSLIGFREIMVNLMEIPTGAIADVCGRRRAMIFSFLAYITSFALFSVASSIPLLFVAMAFFSIGEAFRTGTHKAIIFTWLRLQGLEQEKTRVYGYTRSWSKLGSAAAVIIAGMIVFFTGNYNYIFAFCIIPYGLGIINFLGYPRALDGHAAARGTTPRAVASHLISSLRNAFAKRSIRRLILESMGFEGMFKAAKDYLQPILKTASVPIAAAFIVTQGLEAKQQAVMLILPVFVMLYLLSAAASRNAHRLVARLGTEEQAAGRLWGINLAIFIFLAPVIYLGIYGAMVAGFMALYVVQNFWRPLLISRFACHSSEAQQATILSIESQAKSGATMLIAPVAGFAIDLVKRYQLGVCEFWPLSVLGIIIALGFFLTAKNSPLPGECDIT